MMGSKYGKGTTSEKQMSMGDLQCLSSLIQNSHSYEVRWEAKIEHETFTIVLPPIKVALIQRAACTHTHYLTLKITAYKEEDVMGRRPLFHGQMFLI